MSDVGKAIAKLEQSFNPEAAGDMEEVFQFEIADAGEYYIEIKNGSCSVGSGEHDDPSVTLIMDQETLKGVLKGEVNGMTAFMTGKIKAHGNMMLATKLSNLFSL